MMLSVFLQITDTLTNPLNTNTPANLESLHWYDLFAKGGPVMYPIAALLVITIYVWLYKFFSINTQSKIDDRLIPHVKDQLMGGNLQSAKSYTSNLNTALGRVVDSGVDTIGRPMSEVESNLETAANIELMEMEKHMGVLRIVAGIAPMLGFIGTIAGVIKIFYDISTSNDLSISVISAGLYQKMITSGFGLLTGIIAYSAFNLLTMKIERFGLKLQKAVFDFMRIINTTE
ncbi:MAG: MotA/TolQ/ExbB proton channel family protein [Chitinophagales bacterium]